MFWRRAVNSFCSKLTFLQKMPFPLLRLPLSLSKSPHIG
jgi:hypothetical protein